MSAYRWRRYFSCRSYCGHGCADITSGAECRYGLCRSVFRLMWCRRERLCAVVGYFGDSKYFKNTASPGFFYEDVLLDPRNVGVVSRKGGKHLAKQMASRIFSLQGAPLWMSLSSTIYQTLFHAVFIAVSTGRTICKS